MEQIKTPAISSFVAALLLLAVGAAWDFTTEGGLITVLGGMRADEIEDRIESVNGRFDNLELMLNSAPVAECLPQPAPACPAGWIDNDIVFQDAYNGGDCGLGTKWRLCIRAAEETASRNPGMPERTCPPPAPATDAPAPRRT